MDLRAIALRATALAVASTLGCSGTTPHPASVDLESVEQRVDADALEAVEALLFDPADLGTTDRRRLADLPWLGAEALAGLDSLPPPVDEAALGALPGWNAALARRTAPFVRFAVQRRAVPALVQLDAAPSAAQIRLRTGGLAATLRAPLECWDCAAGAIEVDLGRLALHAGDLRAAAAQGLVAWNSAVRPRALSGWREARGLSGTTSATGSRTVRGVGLALESRRARLALLAGETRDGRAVLGVASFRGRSWHLDGGVGRDAERTAFGAGIDVRRPATRLAAEIAVAAGHVAWTGSAEARTATARAGVRLAVCPEGFAWSLGAFDPERGSARSAELWTGGVWRAIELEVGGMRATFRAPGAMETRRHESWIELATHRAAVDWTLRWTRATTDAEDWDGDAALVRSVTAQSTRLLRATHRVGPGWIATFEARDGMTAKRSPGGDAWRDGWLVALRFERRAGRLQPGVAIASHAVASGVALAAPSLETTLRTARLAGDGLYLAAGCAWRSAVVTAMLSVATRSGAASPARTAWRMAAALRWPPAAR